MSLSPSIQANPQTQPQSVSSVQHHASPGTFQGHAVQWIDIENHFFSRALLVLSISLLAMGTFYHMKCKKGDHLVAVPAFTLGMMGMLCSSVYLCWEKIAGNRAQQSPLTQGNIEGKTVKWKNEDDHSLWGTTISLSLVSIIAGFNELVVCHYNNECTNPELRKSASNVYFAIGAVGTLIPLIWLRRMKKIYAKK